MINADFGCASAFQVFTRWLRVHTIRWQYYGIRTYACIHLYGIRTRVREPINVQTNQTGGWCQNPKEKTHEGVPHSACLVVSFAEHHISCYDHIEALSTHERVYYLNVFVIAPPQL